MEPFEITTVWPDGRTETRLSTPEELAQREADIAEAARLKAEEETWIAEQQAKRQSAIDKLKALGLTEEEALTIVK
jgi:hypothetical protein